MIKSTLVGLMAALTFGAGMCVEAIRSADAVIENDQNDRLLIRDFQTTWVNGAYMTKSRETLTDKRRLMLGSSATPGVWLCRETWSWDAPDLERQHFETCAKLFDPNPYGRLMPEEVERIMAERLSKPSVSNP